MAMIPPDDVVRPKAQDPASFQQGLQALQDPASRGHAGLIQNCLGYLAASGNSRSSSTIRLALAPQSLPTDGISLRGCSQCTNSCSSGKLECSEYGTCHMTEQSSQLIQLPCHCLNADCCSRPDLIHIFRLLQTPRLALPISQVLICKSCC